MGRADNKAATREALIAAALDLFATHGLDGPSLDTICERAGYTRGAFYVHFADRDALLAAVMEHVIGAWIEIIAATADPGGDFDRTVDRFVAAFQGVIARDPTLPPALVASANHFHLVLAACQRSPVVQARFHALIETGTAAIMVAAQDGQDAGTVRGDVDVERAAPLLTALVLGLLAMVEAGVAVDPTRLGEAVRQLTRA